MTAHVLVPALDEERPATLSRAIVHDLLREELGFEGVIFSDDLEMRAVSDRYSIADAACGAIAAGCDGLLVCGTNHDRQAAAIEAVIHAVEREDLPLARVEDALARHRRMKARFLAPNVRRPVLAPKALRALIGRDEHQAIAAAMGSYL